MSTDETLNELLVRLFKDIMEIEGRCLVTDPYTDISYNDFHIIEAIGTKEPKSMSTVAKLMNVTTGTLTKAMDGLTEKEYVIRERSKQDKRVVWVYLTEKGKAAYKHHEEFHWRMISHIKEGLNDKELPVLIYSLAKLVDFFQSVYEPEKQDE
jgi:transcriptional regulator, MarR family|uniref:MarR family winged helix-turn-helix transcriptional regulator n=1 Tax=Roseburia sp. TaxID=2049040 RepID=UPI003FEE977A